MARQCENDNSLGELAEAVLFGEVRSRAAMGSPGNGSFLSSFIKGRTCGGQAYLIGATGGYTCPNTRQALWPPKPKLFFRIRLIFIDRACNGT